jgi:glucose-6-phosphate isomerase
MTAEAVGIFFDYSKNRITDETLRLLIELAKESGLRKRIDAMFRGDKINVTEDRAVLHTALRAPREGSILLDGKNVVPEVHAVLDKMADFSNRIRSGEWKGHTGKRIYNVINIGIGGSDLGPVMAYEALRYYAERSINFRFVSNIDATDFAEAVHGLDPAETLFIVSSKNLHDARDDDQCSNGPILVPCRSQRGRKSRGQAFCGGLDKCRRGGEVRNRYCEHVRILGVGRRQVFNGFRIGLSTMLAIGPENFHRMLKGFHAMDEHCRTAPFEQNLPVLMGLLAIWYKAGPIV